MQKNIIIFLIITFTIGITLQGNTQPNVPKGKIPSDIPKKLAEQIEKLYSTNLEERANAAKVLGNMGKQANIAIPFLIEMLSDPSWVEYYEVAIEPPHKKFCEIVSPAREASKALVKIGESAVEPLLAILNDKNSDVRFEAVCALGQIKDIRSVLPLINALKDEKWNIRLEAAKALGGLKDNRAIEPLINRLDVEGFSSVRDSCAEALRTLTGKDFGRLHEEWEKWWEKDKKFNQ